MRTGINSTAVMMAVLMSATMIMAMTAVMGVTIAALFLF